MVRKEPIPVLMVTLPALISIYLGIELGYISFLLPLFITLVFLSFFLSSWFIIVPHCQFFKNGLLIFFGIFIGLSVLFSLQVKNKPLRTLALRKSITSVYGELLSDPMPAGTDYYRVSFKVEQASTIVGGVYSAHGMISVFFPRDYVLQSMPGGIAVSTMPGLFLAKGLRVTVPVKQGCSMKGQQDRFYFNNTSVNTDVSNPQWKSRTSRLRAGLRFSLIKTLYDWKEPGGLLLALLSSNRDYIPPHLAQGFRNAGLSHILALSGMHLSIIAALALGIGIGTGGKKFAVRFSLLVIILFVWFAGNSPSLDRALIMAITAVIFKKMGVSVKIVPLLAFSCLIQLLISPADTLTLAFKLSYVALAGIILLGRWLTYSIEPFIPSKLSSSITASIGAQVFTAPIVSSSIGILAPVGIIAACVTGPIVTLYLVSGIFLLCLVIVFPVLSNIVSNLYAGLYRFLEVIVLWFSKFPTILIRDLFANLVTSILCISMIFFIYVLYCRISTRRIPDALFSRL